MPQMREVRTCDRCRHFKRRCDLLKPSCSRCMQAGVRCSFDPNGAAAAAASASAASAAASAAPTSAASSTETMGHAASSISGSSPSQDHATTTATTTPTNNGLISPSTSTESPEPSLTGTVDSGVPHDGASGTNTPLAGQRVIRKRKRNCLSCLRCHRLKVKCDKELPCGRCKGSGNGRECYYSYNKGPNGGKFPCPTAPFVANGGDEQKANIATWHVQHKVRGSSHWRDLMTKVCAEAVLLTLPYPPLLSCKMHPKDP